jgi:mannose-6-phosphate isomerase-like protein (cupin superfamily)
VSYPEPRYLGDSGLTNATMRPSADEPDLSYPSGGTVHYLATGESTSGQFGLYRWAMAAVQGGPEPHFHRTISESFFVLSGTVRLYDGTQWADGAPGDFMTVPVGGVHGFRNESGEPASMLLLFVPGAPREEYFETLVELAKGTVVLDERERAEFYLRHDNHWV